MSMLFKRFKDWARSITSFRNGDVIPVDGPSGTAKMGYSDLAKEVIKDSVNNTAATESDLVSGSKIPIMTAGGPKALPGNTIAKASEQDALQAEVTRILAKTDLLTIISNPEYAIAFLDLNDKFLFGVKNDGDFVASKYSDLSKSLNTKVDKIDGKGLVRNAWVDALIDDSNNEYKYAVVDINYKLLFGAKDTGEFYFAKSSEKVDDDWTKALRSVDNVEYSKAMTDDKNRLLDAIRKNGLHEFFTKMKFSGGVDWTSENMAELSNALKA